MDKVKNITTILKKFQNPIYVYLWCIVITWLSKDSITRILFHSKSFVSRSLLIKTAIIAGISFAIFILLMALWFGFKKFIKPLITLNAKSNGNERIQKTLSIILHPVSQLTLMLWVVGFSFIQRGFDITDNGYYLLISHRYEDVFYEIRQAGLFTRLIYLAAGESAAVMRVIGAILLLVVVLLCGWSIGRVNNVKSGEQRALFLTIPAIPALMFYRQWLSTPNYNWLAFIAGLILLTGFMIITKDSHRDNLAGGIVIGIAGFVAFFAKPTTAAFYFMILIFVVLVERKNRKALLQIFTGGMIGLLSGIVFIYLNGQSIPGYYEKIFRGYEAISLFEHSVGSIFDPLWDYLKSLFVDYWWVWIGFTGILSLLKIFGKSSKFGKEKTDSVLVYIWLGCLLLTGLFVDAGLWAGMFFGLTLIVIEIFHRILPDRSSEIDIPRMTILRSLYGLLIAFAIAFGTINQYIWVFANIVCVFVCSILFLIECFPTHVKQLALKGTVILFLVTIPYILFVVPQWSKRPVTYGQDVEVWQMDTEVPIRLGKETVITSTKYAKAFTDLQSDATANGFSEGTPVIDLTGAAPGLIYVLDGRSPVYPWYAGGYPNSTQFVRNILKDWSDADFKKAWVLTSENKRKIPTTLIDERGGVFPGAFQKVSSVVIPTKDNMTVDLWKPSGN